MKSLKELQVLALEKDDDDAFYELGDRLGNSLQAALSRYKDEKALPDDGVQYDAGGQAGTYYIYVNISTNTKNEGLYLWDKDVVKNCNTDQEAEDYYYNEIVKYFG